MCVYAHLLNVIFRNYRTGVTVRGGAVDKNLERPQMRTLKQPGLSTPSHSYAHMRTSQANKIRELRQALINSGFESLDQQAMALGLSRSTTWAVLKGNHKCSGLRAGLIARMWQAPKLPPKAKRILTEYVIEKSRGAYGHSELTRQRFLALLEKAGFPRNNIKALQSVHQILPSQKN